MISYNEKALFREPVKWVFELIKSAYKIDIIGDPKIHISIGDEKENDIRVSKSFYEELLDHKKYNFHNYFISAPIITLEDGEPDYISTIFYLVNGFQEYNYPKDQEDKFGRFDYKHSVQSKFDIAEEDLVKKYVQKLLFQIDGSLKLPLRKSRIFLSHDIDSVYGSLKYDGFWALRNNKIGQMLKVIAHTAMMNPPWFNVDKVARLESEYDIKACYYYIVQNGRDSYGAKNADYRIGNKKIQKQMVVVRELGNEIGLHKSTMDTSFQKEMKMLPEIKSNRFHFLKIDNPASFKEMEDSGVKSDCSIGFPYKMGFKNSFGMPYYPYDLDRKEKFKVLEIPLQIMDGMFDITDAPSGEIAYTKITEFIEANKYDAIISILWHNSEMTNFAYKSSFECYKKVLQYIVDLNYETVLPSQLVNEYETV